MEATLIIYGILILILGLFLGAFFHDMSIGSDYANEEKPETIEKKWKLTVRFIHPNGYTQDLWCDDIKTQDLHNDYIEVIMGEGRTSWVPKGTSILVWDNDNV